MFIDSSPPRRDLNQRLQSYARLGSGHYAPPAHHGATGRDLDGDVLSVNDIRPCRALGRLPRTNFARRLIFSLSGDSTGSTARVRK